MVIKHLKINDVSSKLELVRFIEPGMERVFISPTLNSFAFENANSGETIAITCNQHETVQLILQLNMVKKGEIFTLQRTDLGLSVQIMKTSNMKKEKQHPLFEIHMEIIDHFLAINKKLS